MNNASPPSPRHAPQPALCEPCTLQVLRMVQKGRPLDFYHCSHNRCLALFERAPGRCGPSVKSWTLYGSLNEAGAAELLATAFGVDLEHAHAAFGPGPAQGARH